MIELDVVPNDDWGRTSRADERADLIRGIGERWLAKDHRVRDAGILRDKRGDVLSGIQQRFEAIGDLALLHTQHRDLGDPMREGAEARRLYVDDDEG